MSFQNCHIAAIGEKNRQVCPHQSPAKIPGDSRWRSNSPRSVYKIARCIAGLTPTITLTSSLVYFFVSGPLGVPKCVPEEVFEHTDSFGSFNFYEYLLGDQKSNFFQWRYWRFGNKWQNFEVVISSRFCPRRVERTLWLLLLFY